MSFNQPKGPLGVLGNVGNKFNIPNISCFELEQDPDMFDEMNSFILLGTLQWDTVWQEILFNSLKANPRPLFVANPDIVAPHEKKFSMEPAYYVSHLIKSGIHLPFWLGKPFPTIFELAINRINELSGRHIPLSRIGMVGDTLHTDILGANSYGLKSILMTKYGLLKNENVGSIIKKTRISPFSPSRLAISDFKVPISLPPEMRNGSLRIHSFKPSFSNKLLSNHCLSVRFIKPVVEAVVVSVKNFPVNFDEIKSAEPSMILDVFLYTSGLCFFIHINLHKTLDGPCSFPVFSLIFI